LNIKNILLTFALTLAPLSAQQPSIGIPRVPDSPLRVHLTLTDAQIASLRQIQAQKRAAESAIYSQIGERQRQLNALLSEGSNDAATIGRLMVEINNLRRQLPLPDDPYRAQAVAVLNDAQKAKLPALAEALRLSPAANEAVYYNLLQAPAIVPGPRPLPMPVFLPGSATVDSEP
jgi:Spy/CpxP family protein refolding chaperone